MKEQLKSRILQSSSRTYLFALFVSFLTYPLPHFAADRSACSLQIQLLSAGGSLITRSTTENRINTMIARVNDVLSPGLKKPERLKLKIWEAGNHDRYGIEADHLIEGLPGQTLNYALEFRRSSSETGVEHTRGEELTSPNFFHEYAHAYFAENIRVVSSIFGPVNLVELYARYQALENETKSKIDQLQNRILEIEKLIGTQNDEEILEGLKYPDRPFSVRPGKNWKPFVPPRPVPEEERNELKTERERIANQIGSLDEPVQKARKEVQNIRKQSIALNELWADSIAVLVSGQPDAVVRATPHEAFSPEVAELIRSRDFSATPSDEVLSLGDEHARYISIRRELWKKIQSTDRDLPQQQRFALALFDTIQSELEDLLSNGHDNQIAALERNKDSLEQQYRSLSLHIAFHSIEAMSAPKEQLEADRLKQTNLEARIKSLQRQINLADNQRLLEKLEIRLRRRPSAP